MIPASRLRAASAAAVLVTAAATAAPAAAAQTAGSPGPLFDRRDAWIAAGYLGAAALAFPFDVAIAREVRDSVLQETPGLRRASRAFDLLGVPGTALLAGGLYGAGRLLDQPAMADVGLHATEAFILAEVATLVLKYTAGRTRPRRDPGDAFDFGFLRGFQGSDYQSFPSGHTSGAFAVAATLAHEMERLWGGDAWLYGVATYGPAALVGVSRMFDNHHWASDVVFGAAIGAFSGWKVVKYNHENPDNRVNRWFLAGAWTPGGGVRLLVLPASFAAAPP